MDLRFWRRKPVTEVRPDPNLCEGCQQVRRLSEGLQHKLVIFGKEYTFTRSPRCGPCTIAYMEKFSTRCGNCEQPIFVGEPVAQAPVDAPYPYVHNTMECSYPGMFCGHWGEGVCVPHHS